MTTDSPTHGHLLAGRVAYAQPETGFRSGIEPVLLAAAIPARSGDHVLEAGSGAGATLLCLAARVPGLVATGIERDPALSALASQNARTNGWPELHFVTADINDAPPIGEFEHACANPPYHTTSGTPSPIRGRDAAKRSSDGLLAVWAKVLGHHLRLRGTLTFIVPAAVLPGTIAAFVNAGCQPTTLLPLWPKTGRRAKLTLLRGVKGARSPFCVLPGLVLHTQDGSFTRETEAILREGAPLPM